MFLGRATVKAIFLAFSFQGTGRTIASNTEVDFMLCEKKDSFQLRRWKFRIDVRVVNEVERL